MACGLTILLHRGSITLFSPKDEVESLMSNLEQVVQAQRVAVVVVTLAMVSVSVALAVLLIRGSQVEVPLMLSLVLLGLAAGRHAISSR